MAAKQMRGFLFLLAFFFVSAAGFATGAVLSWNDEHGGVSGTAHVTHCTSHSGSARTGGGVSCDATWSYNGRTVTGYVENAKMNQAGKDISVRIHGTSHVTNTTYWVPLGLALFALFELGVGLMILRVYARRRQLPT
ncbi:MAG TPA: hypothetical protein VF066_00125 [Thermoleophilaceae bacterium]